MSDIKSRIINRGDENESSWPPLMPSENKTPMYFDKETQTMKEGYPPPTFVPHGQAPYYISDTIQPYRHPKTGEITDSKSRLKQIDAATNTITTDKVIKVDSSRDWVRKREASEDRRRAILKSIAQLEAGTAPLTEEQRAICTEKNYAIASQNPGFDPFNCVGRVNDPRGSRYKRKHGSKKRKPGSGSTGS